MMNYHCIHNRNIISGINQLQLHQLAHASCTNDTILSGNEIDANNDEQKIVIEPKSARNFTRSETRKRDWNSDRERNKWNAILIQMCTFM